MRLSFFLAATGCPRGNCAGCFPMQARRLKLGMPAGKSEKPGFWAGSLQRWGLEWRGCLQPSARLEETRVIVAMRPNP